MKEPETYTLTLTFGELTHIYTALEMYRKRSKDLDCPGQVTKTEGIQDAIETQMQQ